MNQQPIVFQPGALDRVATGTDVIFSYKTFAEMNTRQYSLNTRQYSYQIDYGLLCSCKVLKTAINIIYICMRNADFVP